MTCDTMLCSVIFKNKFLMALKLSDFVMKKSEYNHQQGNIVTLYVMYACVLLATCYTVCDVCLCFIGYLLHCNVCLCLIGYIFGQDLKDPRRRDDLAAARAVLKKNSMMLMTTSKVTANQCLVHVWWESALWVRGICVQTDEAKIE
jgi:hypothetical protein